MKFRRKPIVVEAVRWDWDAATAVRFLGKDYGNQWVFVETYDLSLVVATFDGGARCEVGDWIVREPGGVVRVCRAADFAGQYEAIKE